ncbi:hypothetical protein ACQ4M4_10825 [Leptolyngbya sp. AN02str]|uniref:hypothetical protein n=1 Tax=Leptolyngbya sp. AN02str TaxID=3423363 RepID=UPI003D30F18A
MNVDSKNRLWKAIEKIRLLSKKIFAVFLSISMSTYILGVCIFAPYYNWQYSQKNGFISWLFFGEVISCLHAVGWPYFVLNRAEYDTRTSMVVAQKQEFSSLPESQGEIVPPQEAERIAVQRAWEGFLQGAKEKGLTEVEARAIWVQKYEPIVKQQIKELLKKVEVVR